MLKDKMYDAVSDPTEVDNPPRQKNPVPFINFAPLQNAIADLKESASAYEDAIKNVITSHRAMSEADSKKLDAMLIKTERALTRKEGLPRRPWFTHFIYAPGFYTGYGVKTLPGVREALEQRNWKEAGDEVTITAEAISDCAKQIREAAIIINGR